MNILKKVYDKKINEQEADTLYEQLRIDIEKGKYQRYVKNGMIRLDRLMGMDKYEYRAFVFGVDYTTIARWRYEGWPTHCGKTYNFLNYKKDNWMIKRIKKEYCLVKL